MTTAITTTTAAENIAAAAREEAGFDRMLKFKKGTFSVGDDEVALGTEFLAHPAAWTKAWIKFVDEKVAERRFYPVAQGERPAQREDLDELDEAAWPRGRDGKPADPWVFQYYLPLENTETSEVLIFVTSSIGGRRAVSKLCDMFSKRTLKGQLGQPIVSLAVAEMPTKNFGKVPCPAFEIVGWDDAPSAVTSEVSLATAIPVTHTGKAAAKKHDDMDDEIPF